MYPSIPADVTILSHTYPLASDAPACVLVNISPLLTYVSTFWLVPGSSLTFNPELQITFTNSPAEGFVPFKSI